MSRLSTTGLSCLHNSSKNTTSLTHQNLFLPWMRHHASWTSVLGKLGTLLPGEFNSRLHFRMKIRRQRPSFPSLVQMGLSILLLSSSLASKSEGKMTCQIPSMFRKCSRLLILLILMHVLLSVAVHTAI